MDEEVWCGLDLQQLPSLNDVAGLHGGGAAEDDPFWPALAEYVIISHSTSFRFLSSIDLMNHII
jgi:hypothetical protein